MSSQVNFIHIAQNHKRVLLSARHSQTLDMDGRNTTLKKQANKNTFMALLFTVLRWNHIVIYHSYVLLFYKILVAKVIIRRTFDSLMLRKEVVSSQSVRCT